MANPEHVKILEQGVEVWNKWRENNFDIVPDLSGIFQHGKSLNFVNFQNAQIKNAHFEECFLCESNFFKAHIEGIEFIENIVHLANFEHLSGESSSISRV